VAWPDDGSDLPATELPATSVAPDIPSALRLLARGLQPADTVLVTGSCFTVAETLYHLGFTDLEATRVPLAAAGVFDRIGED